MSEDEEKYTELLAHLQGAHNETLARNMLLETAFEAITDGILVCDRDGRIVRLNTAMTHFFNLDLDINADFLTLPFAERMARLNPLDEDGQPLPLEKWPLTRLLRGEHLPSGSNRDLHLILPNHKELYCNYAGSPMRDQNGQITGAVLAIHDVTERHLLENRIQNAFRTLLALAENLTEVPPTGEEIVDDQLSTRPSFQAACERLAQLTYQMLEYRGVSISLIDSLPERLHMVAIAGSTSESKTAYYQKYANILLTELLDEEAIALLHKDKTVIRELALRIVSPLPYRLLLAPMLTDTRLVGILSVEKKGLDPFYTREEISLVKAIAKFILLVIERERARREWLVSHASELALREANQRFDDFLSIASHELRTPLAGMKGNIQLALRRLNALKTGPPTDSAMLLAKLDKVREFLYEADDRVNVQNRMISDLLDVSRIQANKFEMLTHSCDLVKIVSDAVKDEQYNAPERQIIFKTALHEPLLVVGDADRLGQVIHNYLSNALKYSPAYQPVYILVKKVADAVRVAVYDRGPGLTPEERKHVWERFYRVKGVASQSSSTPGLGLGLHICQTIIAAHKGQIGLKSTPGKGSLFWFSLPLA